MKEVDVDHIQWVMELFAEEAVLSEAALNDYTSIFLVHCDATEEMKGTI